jgi:tetratricopeptide (TPR) repeat protein
MKNILLLITIVFSFLFAANTFAQEEKEQKQNTEDNILDKTKIAFKISTAETEMQIGNYRRALVVLREIFDQYPNDGISAYYSAVCHLSLRNYRNAKKYVDIALANDFKRKDVKFLAGEIYHRMGLLDEALTHYESYKAKASKNDIEYLEVDRFIEQINFAKIQMNNPVDVKVKPLHNQVNSKYDEYSPQISPDGKTLYFTSRRSDGIEGGIVDGKGDYKYYENIYVTTWSEKNNDWIDADKVEGVLNEEGSYTSILSLADNAKKMYVYINNSKYKGDIFESKWNTDSAEWNAPKPLDRPINSSYFEGSTSESVDGKTLFFISERPAGFGLGDIWMSKKLENGQWGTPSHLDSNINTDGDEKFVYLHADGKTLFFSSNGHPGLGSYDIYKTTMTDDGFTDPVNLGYPINTVNEEATFSITPDLKYLFLSGERKEAIGERDLFRIDLSKTNLFAEQGFDKNTSVLKGRVMLPQGGDFSSVKIIGTDNSGKEILNKGVAVDGKFVIRLPLNIDLNITVIAEGYQEKKAKLSTGSEAEKSFTRNYILSK